MGRDRFAGARALGVIAIFGTVFGIAACSPGGEGGAASAASAIDPAVVAAESQRLTEWLDAEFEEELAFSPERLTRLGRKDQYDRLDVRTEAQDDMELDWRRASVAEMKASFDPAKLSDTARTSYDIWEQALEQAELAHQFRRQGYVFARGGAHTGLPNFMINFHRVDEKADMEAYIARLGQIDDALSQLMARTVVAADDGVRQPRFAYEQAKEEAQKVITGEPFSTGRDSPLFADAKSKIEALLSAGKITPDEAAGLRLQTAAVMREQVEPAYEALISWLETDIEYAPEESQGAGALPNGEAYYNARLKLMTTTDMTADEIHQLGLSEVARIKAEMEQIKTQVGFAGTLEDFFVFMRTDPRFYLSNTDDGRAEYIRIADGYIAGMRAKLPEYFGILPKADVVVKRVEAFREEPGGAQHYFASAPDGSRPGVFYAHLSDMNAMPVYQLENITYHEALPGHHMQIAIAQELTGLPKFRTQYGFTAFSEGWGLYTEKLGKEMGFYTDPYSNFGRLAGEIWRAIRLVVDTGLHAKGWSEEEAVQYFLANSPQPEGAIRSEIRRYIVTPGQATAYKVGMIKIQDFREKARAELGDKFDIRAFHDVVLGGGSQPMSVLEQRIDRWIERVKAEG
ncbi:DUF885 family protein [bacterium]|nr:DUF885 family protein [bacterium]